MTAPDPMKGLRGIFAATLVLEAIAVGLSLLLPAVSGTTSWLIAGLGVLMLAASGLQRRAWGLGLALALQVLTVAVGLLLVPALGIIGVLFAAVWAFLLYLRHDVAARLARGELPSQQPPA